MSDSRLSRIAETTQQWRDRKDSNSQLAFERKVVRKLLECMGVTKIEQNFKYRRSDCAEDFYMSCAWLREVHPECPVILVAHEELEPSLEDIFYPTRRSAKALWKAWANTLEDLYNESGAFDVGCVFNARNMGVPLMVMHTAQTSYPDSEEYIRIHRVIRSAGIGDVHITVEPITSFCTRLSTIWEI